MIIRVNEVRVDASLLDGVDNLALYLLFLRLLDGDLQLLVLDRLGNAGLVESDGLHGSDLHGDLMAGLCIVLVELNHGAEGVLVHVVVDLHVVTLNEVVAVELHLLTRDTGALLNSGSGILAVGELESLHLIDALRLSSDGSVEDLLYHIDEILACGNEVGLTLHSHHSGEACNFLDEDATIGSLTVGTLGSDSEATLTEEILGLVEVAFCLNQ